MARLSGRVTSRLIATARGSVLYSVVVYYARRSSAEYARPLSIQNSCTRSVYARVRRAPDRTGEHAEGGRSKKQEEERRGKRKGERSARSRGSTYM